MNKKTRYPYFLHLYRSLKRKLTPNSYTLLLCLTSSIALIIGFFWGKEKTRIRTPSSVQTLPLSPHTHAADALHWKKITVHPRETLSDLLQHESIAYGTVKTILALPEVKKYWATLYPQQVFYLGRRSEQKDLFLLRYPITPLKELTIQVNHHKATAQITHLPQQQVILYKKVTLHTALFEDALHAGLTLQQAAQLQTLFRGTVNLRNLQAGSTLEVLYPGSYHAHQLVNTDPFLLATLTTKKKTYTLVQFTHASGKKNYYHLNGSGIEPLFLPTPVHYKRISSPFMPHRYNPILHIIRPHLGVDFAAPQNTPVYSIGNGHILYTGKKGGYGNTVIVKYRQNYKALYAHLCGFAKHIAKGHPIKKGGVLGYVGSTGWSTGPHLHFGLYHKGVPQDPLKLPQQVQNIHLSEQNAFNKVASSLKKRLVDHRYIRQPNTME